jgi:hypothetical protein
MRLFTLLAIVLVGSTSPASAQDADRQQILTETVRHMRSKLGEAMVIDKSVQARFASDTFITAKLGEMLMQTGVEMVDSRANRRCTDTGKAYFEGPETYLTLMNPHIVDGRATIRVAWSSTGQSLEYLYMNTFTSVIDLQNVDGRWTVTRESSREFLNIANHYCE